MPTIPESALPNLHRYKYGGVDKSLTSRYILTPFWNNLVKIVPLWIAYVFNKGTARNQKEKKKKEEKEGKKGKQMLMLI